MLPSTISSGPVAFFVLLQLQAWTSRASLIRRQDGDSDSDSDSDLDSDSESCQNNVCVKESCSRGVCTTVTSTKGVKGGAAGPTPTNGASGTVGITQTPATTPAPGATSHTKGHQQTSQSSTDSLSAGPSQQTNVSGLSDKSDGLSKGGIAGIVLAIVFIIGLAIMCLTAYRNRRRRAQTKPQGFVPATFLTGPPATHSNTPNNNNEMSPVEFANRSPVTVATRMNRNIRGSADNNYNTIPTSPALAPLLPGVASGYEGRERPLPPSRGNNQHNHTRSLSRGDNGSILTSPYSDHHHTSIYVDAPLPPLPHEADRAGGSNIPAGTLHSDIRAYQKALEADNTKRTEAAMASQEPGIDPPPSYFPMR